MMHEQTRYDLYRQLEDFLDGAKGRVFWILTYAHLFGIFGGLFLGRLLQPLFPVWMATPLMVLGALAGLACTWKRQERPLYHIAWSLARYWGRQWLRLGSPEIRAEDLYAVPQPTAAPVLWMGEGGRPVLAYRGGETAAPVEIGKGR
jgi:hypothetical protein